MTWEEAYNTAEAYFAEEKEMVMTVYEDEQDWIFFGGVLGEESIGTDIVSIHKADGVMYEFILPNKENFQKLDMARKIYEREA